MEQLLYPIGIQSFSEIRRNGFIYVDKTDYIHRLVTTGKYYFLSRPRRFGKSLLISTIDEFFRGSRELFDGLAISRHDHSWESHPVLHLDLSGFRGDTRESLAGRLCLNITRWEKELGITTDASLSPEDRFQDLIIQAHEKTGKRVAILVDEYDKPLLETVNDTPLQDSFRSQLRAFYSNLKSQDAHIRFAMLTGVTKFGHLSIFSDLNNLRDISLSDVYSGICGVTKEELLGPLEPAVRDFAETRNMTVGQVYGELRANYDGYHFSPEDSADVYNPFSLLNSLEDKRIRDYWFSTGTPTFLVKMVKERSIPIRELAEYRVPLTSLSDVSFDLGNPIPVLYQSGYLTIKGYDPRSERVTLGFPNREVEKGFLNSLLPIYTLRRNRTAFSVFDFIDDLEAGDADSFMTRLQSLFADFPYDSFNLRDMEQHYQDVTFILAKLMGFDTHVEYRTAKGRIDLLVKTPEFIYVFEFKLDGTAEEALAQIDDRNYLIPFRADGRTIVKVGANFSSDGRIPDDWKIESVDPLK